MVPGRGQNRVLPRQLSRARLDRRSSWRMPTAESARARERARPAVFRARFLCRAAWSPDGARIAAAIRDSSDRAMPVWSPLTRRPERSMPFPQRFQDATFTAWLPDGSGILFVVNQVDALREFPRKVWLQPYPRGDASPRHAGPPRVSKHLGARRRPRICLGRARCRSIHSGGCRSAVDDPSASPRNDTTAARRCSSRRTAAWW